MKNHHPDRCGAVSLTAVLCALWMCLTECDARADAFVREYQAVSMSAQAAPEVQAFGPVHSSTAMVLNENEDIVFAEFSFEEDLAPGTELEVWPSVEGEILPWDLDEGTLSFPRNFWIVDDRSGSLARFDVTEIVRAWHYESLANLGLVLRVSNQVEESGSQAERFPLLGLVRNVTLTYHTQPVRPPTRVTGSTSESEHSGKSPNAQDAKDDHHD